MSSINGVTSDPALSAANRDEGAVRGSTSKSSQDWRQAFEQARQVGYGDWFGSGGPTVLQLPKPKVATETTNALLRASLRQSLQPDDAAGVEFRSVPVVAEPVPEGHLSKARTTETVEQSHVQHANPASAGQLINDAPAEKSVAYSVTESDPIVPVEATVQTTPVTHDGGSDGSATTTHPMASKAVSHTRSDDHATGIALPAVANQAAETAVVQALPIVAGAIDASGSPVGIVELALSGAAPGTIDSPESALRSEFQPVPTAAIARASASPSNVVPVDEHEELSKPEITSEARASSRTAPTAADSGNETPRVHAELSDDGLKIWLGIEIDESLPGQLEALLVQLHPMLAAHGQPLAELFCNGRSVWRAPPRPSDSPVQRRLQSLEVVPLTTDPMPQEAI